MSNSEKFRGVTYKTCQCTDTQSPWSWAQFPMKSNILPPQFACYSANFLSCFHSSIVSWVHSSAPLFHSSAFPLCSPVSDTFSFPLYISPLDFETAPHHSTSIVLILKSLSPSHFLNKALSIIRPHCLPGITVLPTQHVLKRTNLLFLSLCVPFLSPPPSI